MNVPRILFVLPAAGGSGGVNSVVQECKGLAEMGVTVGIAVDAVNHGRLITAYPELETTSVSLASYGSIRELSALMAQWDVTVATTNNSIYEVAAGHAVLPPKQKDVHRIAYYVQDYEPLFYPFRSDRWKKAYESYAHVREAVLFAKTNWICNMVYANHGVRVSKVEASLDRSIFFPDLSERRLKPSVAAMVRPSTPRRAPRRTLRILERLVDRFGAELDARIFGCDAADLASAGYDLSPRIRNLGRLRRDEVPDLLRSTDLFLDLSDYQAFGRTGLEAMACGCIPVLPILGGTDEFAEHGRNAFVVDTRSDDEILKAVATFLAMSPATREAMQENALQTAAGYSVHRAVLSELRVFRQLSQPNEAG